MAYGVKFRLEFEDELGRGKRVDILKKDYTGSITNVTGAGFSPLFTSIQNQGDPKYETVRGTEIELNVYAELQVDKTVSISNGTLYMIGKITSGAGDDLSISKRQLEFDYTTSPATVTSFGTVSGVTIEDDLGLSGYVFIRNKGNSSIYKLQNGNIVVYLTGSAANPGKSLILLDENLNLINNTKTNLSDWGGEHSPYSITQDESNNIYVHEQFDSGSISDQRAKVVKYNSSLEKQWESTLRASDLFTGSIVCGTDNVFCFSGHNLDGSGILSAISKSDGSTVATKTYSNGITCPCVLPNKQILLIDRGADDTDSSTQTVYILDEELNTIDSETGDNISNYANVDSLLFALTGWILGTKVLVAIKQSSSVSKAMFLDYSNWSSTTVDIYDTGAAGSTEQFGGNLTWLEDGKILASNYATSGGAEATGGITILDPSTETVLLDQIDVEGITGTTEEIHHHGKHINWQLFAFKGVENDIDFSEIITATDTDYKIEIYEEAAAS